MFFRIIQHLLPNALAWRVTVQKTLRSFFEGLAAGAPQDARDFIDAVFFDAFPATTRELAEWERQFGLEPNGDEATRRLALAAEWAASGGQSAAYIQDVLQTAGFNVYVHESWFSGPPYVFKDPHNYTTTPMVGSVQCLGDGPADGSAPGSYLESVQPQCSDGLPDIHGEVPTQYQCDRFLMNDPHYWVNLNLTETAPPPIPDDPKFWPFFLYIGGSTFGTQAVVPFARRDEFRRLVQKLKPSHLWIVTLINFDPDVSGLFYFGGGDGFSGGAWAP